MVQVDVFALEQRLNILVGTRAPIDAVLALVGLIRSPCDHEFRAGDHFESVWTRLGGRVNKETRVTKEL